MKSAEEWRKEWLETRESLGRDLLPIDFIEFIKRIQANQREVAADKLMEMTKSESLKADELSNADSLSQRINNYHSTRAKTFEEAADIIRKG